MSRNFREFRQVFYFTIRQQFKSAGYRRSIIIMSILCFFIPAMIFIGGEITGLREDRAAVEQAAGGAAGGESDTEGGGQTDGQMDIGTIKKIFYLDNCEKPITDAAKVAAVLKERTGKDIEVIDYKKDFEKADKDSKKTSDTIMLIMHQGNNYHMNLVEPDEALFVKKDVDNLEEILNTYSFALAAEVNKKDAAGQAGGEAGGEGGEEEKPMSEEEARQQELKEAKDLIVALVSYFNVMLVYFFVLLYGQSVANSVVLEKSSKLMEAFLVSVRPGNIVLGKMIGIALSGIVQLGSWLISLALGFFVGIKGVLYLNPESDMKFLDILEGLRAMTSGLFTLPNVLLGILFAFLGILLYCSLAGIGGSMASRQEDLVTTNIVFSLTVIGSFFLVMFGGSLEGIDKGSPFIDWFPFTSIMIMPARILVGGVPAGKILASGAIVVASILLLAWFSGKVYRAMVFYRGDAAGAFKFMRSAVMKKEEKAKS